MAAPDEFSVRGRARLIPQGPARDTVANGWFFEVDDTYWLFELQIQTAILGERAADERSEEHTSELHHMSISYAVFCLKKKKKKRKPIYQRKRKILYSSKPNTHVTVLHNY